MLSSLFGNNNSKTKSNSFGLFVFILVLAFGLTYIFFRDIVAGHRFLWNDQLVQFYPFRYFVAEAFKKWGMLFWNPYIFAGVPVMENVQIAFFYPTNILFNVFYLATGRMSYHIYQIFVLIHIVICFVATFFAFDMLKKDKLLSFFASVVFTFSSFFILHLIHFSFIQTMMFSPLVLALFIKYIQTNKWLYGTLLSIFVCISFLGGYAQYLYYFMIFLVAVWVFINFELLLPFKKKVFKKAFVWIYLLLGIMGASVLWIPAFDFVDETVRESITIEEAQISSFRPETLIRFIVPRFFGESRNDVAPVSNAKQPYSESVHVPFFGGDAFFEYWETSVYFAMAPLIFLILFFVAYKDRRKKVILLSFYLLTIALMFGKHFFIYELFFNFFPGFARFRNPGRLSFYIALASTFIVFLKFDFIAESIKSFSYKKLLVLIAPFVALPILAMMVTDFPFTAAKEFASIESTWAVVILCVVVSLIFAFKKGVLNKKILLFILCVITFFDLYRANSSFNSGRLNADELHGRFIDVDFLKSTPEDRFRVRTRVDHVMLFERNSGMINHIEAIEGYDPLHPSVFFNFLHKSNIAGRIEMLNVKYALRPDRSGIDLLEHYWPRYFFTSTVTHSVDFDMLSSHFGDIGYRTPQAVFQLSELPISIQKEESGFSGVVKEIDYRPDRLLLEVNAARNGALIINSPYYKRWNARNVNTGEQIDIHMANGVHKAFFLEKGNHLIEVYYDKSVFILGAIFSLIGLILIVGFSMLNYKNSNFFGFNEKNIDTQS